MSGSSSPMLGQSDAEREDMLDRMLTRLALADNSKLQPLLADILPYSIASLASTSASIRKTVMDILSHVNKRVKHQVEIKLPVLDLWKLYQEEDATSMVKNFCIVYMEMALDRLSMEEKIKLVPDLLCYLSKLSAQHQDIILRIITKVIGDCKSGDLNESLNNISKMKDHDKDVKLLLEFCMQTILYCPSSSRACPPGLSISLTNRVTGKLPLDGDLLLRRKVGILNVVDIMDLPSEQVYPLYLAACSDSVEPVLRKGDELLKKVSSRVNLEDPDLIKKLFVLFNGSTTVGNDTPESKIAPGSFALRLRLMTIFCRSIAAANTFPSTLQCIFGCIFGSETNYKLRQLGMEFTVWVFKHAVMDQLKLMGPVILSGILRYIDGEVNSGSEHIPGDVKSFAFQAIGLLAARLPMLFREKVDMARRLFNALRTEDKYLHLTVKEALVSLASAYKNAPVAVLNELEALLLENSYAEQNDVRFCAVRWATLLYDRCHCPSRFICILATEDSDVAIREMAFEGLTLQKNHGHNHENKTGGFPKLKDMLDYIFHQKPQLLNSTEITNVLLFPSKMYCAMIAFLMKCFDNDYHLDGINTELDSPSCATTLCLLLEHGMSFEGTAELHATASKALVSLGYRLPKLIAQRYAERLPWLKDLLGHIDLDTRVAISRLLGITCEELPSSAACALVTEIMPSSTGSKPLRFEDYHGKICAMGYVTAECLKAKHVSISFAEIVVRALIDIVASESNTLVSSAMEALGHIGLRSELPKICYNSRSGGVLIILKDMLEKMIAGNDTNAVKKITVSIGHICLYETSIPDLNVGLDLIFSLCRSKVEDVLFACGEALSFFWGEPPISADVILKSNFESLSKLSKFLSEECQSSVVRNSLFISDSNSEVRVHVREIITRKLFTTLLYSTRKEERCAGSVWLLSLLVYCGQHPKIQEILPEIQEAFSHLLGDQHELTQELASQGMGIVYELGDELTKKKLVDALLSTLTDSGKRKRAIKLTEDSEVFQEGTFRENAGEKLSTYKELCNLANDMGQPDLIYKFMNLANYQSTLNSKRGAAFSFSRIAKLAGEALQPHMSLLIPRLFRYQFDPDKNVQEAMGHIWKSIVSDSKKTIDDFFDIIVNDLLTQSESRFWRSREASCLALVDIIQGRKFHQVSKYLKRLWQATFRSMDDIKETVRNAADSLCRALSSLTIRLCDVQLTEPSDAAVTMGIVLPILLSDGINSKVSSIQRASIAIVTKISKGAGKALHPYLTDLVCCMLESLSSLEDQRLNYVELHAESAGIQANKLENLRIAIAKDSPMWDTLSICLDAVDTNSLELLVPRLSQLVRSGVGLNTRVGVANFTTLLVQKVTSDIKRFASSLLKLLFQTVIQEKGFAAKRAFAIACATILKYAGQIQAQKLIDDTAALHKGDRNSLLSCSLLLENYIKYAADVACSHYTIILPVAFISRFDDDKDVSNLFEELWEENISGEIATLRLYLNELTMLLCDCITSSSWPSKRKSAKAITMLSEVLGVDLSPFHRALLECLLKEVPGRLWEGKEVLLHAVASICCSCHEAILAENSNFQNTIIDVISSACRKKGNPYREVALSSLSKIIKAFGHEGLFKRVFPLLVELCDQMGATLLDNESLSHATINKEDFGSNSSEDGSIPLDKVIDCVSSCLHVASILDIVEEWKSVLNIILYSLSPKFSLPVKLSVLSLVKTLSSTISNAHKDTLFSSKGQLLVDELYHTLAPRIVESVSTVKISQVQLAAAECLLDIVDMFKSVSSEESKDDKFTEEILKLCAAQKNELVKSTLQRCIDIMNGSKDRSCKG